MSPSSYLDGASLVGPGQYPRYNSAVKEGRPWVAQATDKAARHHKNTTRIRSTPKLSHHFSYRNLVMLQHVVVNFFQGYYHPRHDMSIAKVISMRTHQVRKQPGLTILGTVGLCSVPLLLSVSGATRRGRRRHGNQAAGAKYSMWREASENISSFIQKKMKCTP